MRLIAVDLDDTLLRRNKTLSAYTLNILDRCREKGMLIAFATARNECNARQHIAMVHPEVIISSGGALIRAHGEILNVCQFSAEETAALIDAGRTMSTGRAMITVDTLDSHYENYRADFDDEDLDWGAMIHTDFANFQSPSLKVCVHLPSPDDAAKVAAVVPNCEWVRFYGTDWYRFAKANASKDGALAALSAKMGIPMEEMIAFGDDYGDVGMIQSCGVGIAMQNAIPEALAAADGICEDCDQDGVARELERRFLCD